MSHVMYLPAMGMVNALGNDRTIIQERLFSGKQEGIQSASGWLVDTDVMLGCVTEELPVIPETFMGYQSRNFRLLLAAYEQIASVVEEMKQTYGSMRLGVVVGVSAQGIDVAEEAYGCVMEEGGFPASYQYSQQELGTASVGLAEYAGIQGPVYSVGTSCSSSAKAFASARNLIEMGLCDAVVVGGVDALCRLTVRGFSSLKAISSGVTNPMSRHRDGITLGEGAALFVMCREGEGVALLGVGESCDAHHISGPDPDGRGAEQSMRAALDDAGLSPEQIDYLNLHGTGTQQNDAMESKAVDRVFGMSLPCSSTKPLTGHTLGAAGATEVGVCWLMLQSSGDALALPPHRWDQQQDDELPTLYLVKEDTTIPRRNTMTLMSNSFAFGGNNCSVIVGVRG